MLVDLGNISSGRSLGLTVLFFVPLWLPPVWGFGGLGVWGFGGLGVWGFGGLGVWGFGGLGVGVLGCGVWSLGCGVWGCGSWGFKLFNVGFRV